jgi:hypothetical protein
MAREIATLLARIFAERRNAGRTDLEAIEAALRGGLHKVGAAALAGLLQGDTPSVEQRQLPCPCGHTAHYVELRAKTIITVVGEVQLRRPYYLCAHCRQGQFPADRELDVEKSSQSPGVRRMLAALGHAAPFDHGRRQLELLAGLKVTTKAVERLCRIMEILRWGTIESYVCARHASLRDFPSTHLSRHHRYLMGAAEGLRAED